MTPRNRCATPRAILLSLYCALAVSQASAENFDVQSFESAEQAERFERLTHELRCPKCQNQSIADSNAPIAQDLRQRTYELMQDGRSDAEIVAWLSERYGEFISYRPAFGGMTWLLWCGPFLLLAGALLAIGAFLRTRRAESAMPMREDAAEARKVESILRRFDETDDDGERRS